VQGGMTRLKTRTATPAPVDTGLNLDDKG